MSSIKLTSVLQYGIKQSKHHDHLPSPTFATLQCLSVNHCVFIRCLCLHVDLISFCDEAFFISPRPDPFAVLCLCVW